MKLAKKSLMLILSFLVMAAAVVMPVSASAFQDTEGHWAQSDIAEWGNKGVLQGYDGSFRPDDSITRAEFATILNNIMQYIQSGKNAFSDLNPDDWYYDAMIKLHAAGVMNGNDGKAMPGNAITRQEAVVLMARAFHIQGDSTDIPFHDADEIAGWARASVSALAERGVLNGKSDGSFDPTAPLSRAEAITIVSNLIEELYTAPGEYSGDVAGNVVVNADGVILKDMEISGDLFIAQGVGEGEVTLENVVEEGTVIVEGGGENSIIFNNVQVRGALVVNKYNGVVRILATGNTSVSVTTLQNGAMIVTRDLTGGGFETIEIPADLVAGAEIVLDGNFKKVVNYSPTAKISATGKIAELVAESDTNITGDVTVDKVTAGEDVSASINDRPVSGQPSTGGSRGSGRGGSGGGGGSDDDDEDTTEIAVTGVSIEGALAKLVIGESTALTAVVTPENAANKNVVWEVADGEADVASVDESGMVTAIATGSETIRVTTEDGGYTDEITVEVVKPGFAVEISKFEGAVVDPEAEIDASVIANSEQLEIVSHELSLTDENLSEAVITAEDPLTAASESLVGNYAHFVVTLKGIDGQPIQDPADVSVTVTDVTYKSVTGDVYNYVPQFGVNLADGHKEGSFVFLINAGEPEEIQQYDLHFSHGSYLDTSLSILYVPAGTAYVTGVEPITGAAEEGAELTAGAILYEGTPANDKVSYTWMRAEQAEGPYSIIDGADTAQYVLTNADAGHYVRVKVSADQTEVGGWAISDPIGPVKALVKAEDVYEAIEAVYLADNTAPDNIVSQLNLMTSLSEFPDVTISWASSDESIISNSGAVSRSSEADQTVTLTVTLDGVVGETSKTYTLTVKMLGLDTELEGFIDPYFAADYPQAYIKDGTIWVKFQLNQPAEVFMVVNTSNGYWGSTVKSVLEGRAGEADNDVVYVDEWPYFDVTDISKVIEFDTGVSLASWSPETRVDFVIRDSDYLSEEVTSIVFTQEIVEYVDTTGPYDTGIFITDALDEIYIYFGEELDLTSVPDVTDFALSHGSIQAVEMHNFEDPRMVYAYVKLDVTGIIEDVREELKLSYTGTAIRDTAIALNPAYTFINKPVDFLDNATIERVTISSDRKSMKVTLDQQLHFSESTSKDYFAHVRLHIRADGEVIDMFDRSGVTWIGTDYMEYWAKFSEPLPDGPVEVALDASGFVNYALDSFPELIQADPEDFEVIPASGTPSAIYDSLFAEIQLTFAEGFDFDSSSYAGGFVLKVDEVEYSLRGFIGYTYDNELHLNLNGEYETRFREAIENGSEIFIKYEKINGDSDNQLSDAAGGLLPDFDYIHVEKL